MNEKQIIKELTPLTIHIENIHISEIHIQHMLNPEPSIRNLEKTSSKTNNHNVVKNNKPIKSKKRKLSTVKRRITSKYESKVLNELYSKTPKPDKKYIEDVASELNWSYKRVKQWFSNRRLNRSKFVS